MSPAEICCRFHRGYGVFEGNRARRAFRSATARPLVLVAQQFLVLLHLLAEILESRFDGCNRCSTAFLCSQLSCRQSQIQRHIETVTCVFLDAALQMQGVGPKDLKVPAQLFHLLVDEFFEVGCFRNLVADLNIHERPLRTEQFRPQLQPSSKLDFTPPNTEASGK